MKRAEDKISQSSEIIPFSYSPAIIQNYLRNVYKDVTILDGQDNPHKAIAASGSILFKFLPSGAEEQVIKEVKADVKSINKNGSLIKSIIYIVNDDQFLNPEYKNKFIAKTNTKSIDITPYSICKKYLQNYYDSPDSITTELVNKHLTKIKTPQLTPVLIKIMEYVAELPEPDTIPYSPDDKQLTHLDNKINLNFANHLRKDVHDDILSYWHYKMIIEQFIKKYKHKYYSDFKRLKSRIIISYLNQNKETAENTVGNISIFNSVAESIIPSDLKDNEIAFDCAKALVYYFFEYCLFGKKTPDDDPQFDFGDSE